MTQGGANVRGFLIVAIAVYIAVFSDDQVLAAIPPGVKVIIHAIAIGLVTFRAYIDTSNADAKQTDRPQIAQQNNAGPGAPSAAPPDPAHPPVAPGAGVQSPDP